MQKLEEVQWPLSFFLRQVSDTLKSTSLDSLDQPSCSADWLTLLDLCTRMLLLVSAMSQAAQTDVAKVTTGRLHFSAAAGTAAVHRHMCFTEPACAGQARA